jgi:LD-carboxypeptidase N-terminal domain
MAAFADPSIRAVLATIGGDDEITLLPHLDPGVVVACPKPFAGYSDNTNLLNWLWNLGVPSYHGGSTMVHLGRGGRLHPRLVRVAARGSHRRRGPGPAPGRGLQRRRAGLGRPESPRAGALHPAGRGAVVRRDGPAAAGPPHKGARHPVQLDQDIRRGCGTPRATRRPPEHSRRHSRPRPSDQTACWAPDWPPLTDRPRRAYATAAGGPWEWRMRPSGLVAVVVPSGWQVIFQPQRWITMMW